VARAKVEVATSFEPYDFPIASKKLRIKLLSIEKTELKSMCYKSSAKPLFKALPNHPTPQATTQHPQRRLHAPVF
jgi:hypothetical protein